MNICLFNLVLNVEYEGLGRFESGNEMCRNDDGSVFRDITTGFFSPFLCSETAKSSEVNIFTVGKRAFYCVHKSLNSLLYTTFSILVLLAISATISAFVMLISCFNDLKINFLNGVQI